MEDQRAQARSSADRMKNKLSLVPLLYTNTGYRVPQNA